MITREKFSEANADAEQTGHFALPALTLLVLRCKDLKASLNFYEQLGLEFRPEQHGDGPLHFSANLKGTILELYSLATDGVAIEPTRLGFAVSSLTDTLRAIGSEPLSGKRAVVLDPDGRKIELIERNEDYS